MATLKNARIFAEFRPNISMVAITISLTTPANMSTSSKLSMDCSQFILTHNDEIYAIGLPAEVSPQADRQTPGPFQHEARLVAQELPCFRQTPVDQTLVPWSAPTLNSNVELTCNSCNATILSRGTVKTWKDLPSEGWAEMMDLWHCHKPNEHDHGDGDAISTRGYSASSKLVSKSETGFVDVMSFLLMQADCTGVQINMPNNEVDASPVSCNSCDAVLGYKDDQAEGLRLHKLSLALSTRATSHPQIFAPSKWLSCHLLSAIETQGVRKFIFSTLPYEIWVFSSDVCYSSLAEPKPTRAIKVYFRKTETNNIDIDTLRAQNLHIETLALPVRLEEMLLGLLQRSNYSLPDKVAQFLDWKVGFLPKFTTKDVQT